MWLRLARRFGVSYVDKPLSEYRLTSNYNLRNVEILVRETEYVVDKQLREADDEEARLAAYLAAACLHERSVEVICWGLIHRSDYVGTGCV